MEAMNEQSGQVPVAKKSKGRRILRWVLTLVGVLLLFVIVAAAALPGMLSGGWGKQRVLSAINGSISGTVSIEKMKLRWFGGQTLDRVKLMDAEGKEVANVKHVGVPVGLWTLMMGGRDLGMIEVDQPVLTVKANKGGGTNLTEAVTVREKKGAKPQAANKEPFALPVRFKLKLTDGKITVTPVEGADVVFDKVNVTANAAASHKPVTFELSTLTQQGELSGKVAATGSVNLASGEVESLVDVNDLPTAGLDTLMNQGGVLTAALGPTLNAHAAMTVSETGGKLMLKAEAANLSANFDATATKEAVIGSGHMKFTMTPALMRKLAERGGGTSGATSGGGELAGDVPVTVTIEKMSSPTGGFDPSKVAGKVVLEIGAGRLTGLKDGGDVSWSDFAVTTASENLAEKIQFAANGKFVAGGRAGVLIGSADVSSLFDAQGKLAIAQAKVDAEVTATDLPVDLADRLTGQAGRLTEMLGDRLNMTATARSDGKGRINVTLKADSPTMTAVLPVTIGERISLPPGSSGRVTFTVPPVMLKKYVTDVSGYGVKVGQPMALTLETLDMPMPGAISGAGKKLAPADVTLKATLTVKDVEVTDGGIAKPQAAGAMVGPVHLATVVVTVDGQPMDKPRVTAGLEWEAGEKSMVAQYAASGFVMNVDATTTLDEQFQPGDILLTVDGKKTTSEPQPLTDLALTGRISKGFERFTLIGGSFGKLTYRLLPGVASASGTVKLMLSELDVPLKGFALGGVKAKANVAMPAVMLSGDPRIAGTTLSNGAADVTFDGPGNALKLTMNAKTQLPNQTSMGAMAVDADLKWILTDGKLNVMKATGAANVKLTDVPTAFVDAMTKQDGLIVAMLGDKVNVDAALNASSGGQRTANVAVHSALLDVEGAVSLAEGKPIEVTKPVAVNWTMRPDAFAKLAGTDATLIEPVKVTGTVTQLSLPTVGGRGLSGAKVDARFGAGKVSLRPKGTSGTATVSDLRLDVSSADLSKAMTAMMTGVVGYADPAQAADGMAGLVGKLDVNAVLSDLFDPAPAPGSTPGSTPAPGMKVNVAGMNADVKATLSDVPTASLDALAKQNGLIAAALGDKVTLGANATLRGGKGPVTVTIDSPLAKAKVPARMDAGVLTLTDTMTASFMLTEDLSKKLVDHPLLKEAVKSEQPVTLVVAKEGFRLPVSMLMSDDEQVRQRGIEQTMIGKATIDPGKILVKNSGLINALVTLPTDVTKGLGSLGRGAVAQLPVLGDWVGQQTVTAWFTPMDVSMKDGVARLGRMDMLLGDDYQVATWGVLNYGSAETKDGDQKIGAGRGRMVLGIVERALRRVFGIKDYQKTPEYVDQSVMEGPVAKLSVDEGKLGLHLVGLLAKGRGIGIGGKKGREIADLIGTGVDIVLKSDDKPSGPAPAPHLPYPWPPEAKPTDQQPTAPTDSPQDQPAPQPPKKQSPEERIINDVFDLLGKKKK